MLHLWKFLVSMIGLAFARVRSKSKKDNPKNLPVLQFEVEELDLGPRFPESKIRNLKLIDVGHLFKDVPWVKDESGWYRRSVRAWLPKEHPVTTGFHYDFICFWGEVELMQETNVGYAGNGFIKQTPESTVSNIYFSTGFFDLIGESRKFGLTLKGERNNERVAVRKQIRR